MEISKTNTDLPGSKCVVWWAKIIALWYNKHYVSKLTFYNITFYLKKYTKQHCNVNIQQCYSSFWMVWGLTD